jgi:hypothetical protein
VKILAPTDIVFRRKVQKDTTIQNCQTSMINLQSGWFVDKVRGEVNFHNSNALIHNLVHQYHKYEIADRGDSAQNRLSCVNKSTKFEQKYRDTQAKLVAQIRERINNVKSGIAKPRP